MIAFCECDRPLSDSRGWCSNCGDRLGEDERDKEISDLRTRIADLEAERDAAKAGAARAVEALTECHRILAKQSKDPGDYSPRNFDEKQVLAIAEHHGYGNLMVLLSSKWYAQQRGGAFSVGDCYSTNRKAAKSADAVIESAQPALDWLAQREREAAARELEQFMKNEWIESFELKAIIHARIAALTTQQPTACFREEK
jgi:hypothetical protein